MSNKSNDERKSKRESRSDLTLSKDTNDETDVFTERLEFPRCVKYPIRLFKTFKVKS